MRQLFLVALALVTAFSLSVGATAKQAQAQELTDLVITLTTDITVSEECDAEGTCRNVSFDAVLGASLGIGVEIPQEILNVLAEVAVIQFEVTDAEGNLVGTYSPGETDCLPPGTYTVTTSVVNAEALIGALEAVLPPGVGIDLEASLLTSTEQIVVPECPDDGVAPPDDDNGVPGPGDGQIGGDTGDISIGDITAGQCLAIINNTGIQYDATIVQYCYQIINNINEGAPADGVAPPGDGVDDGIPGDGAGAGAATLNLQQCIAVFGDQSAAQYQVGAEGSLQELTQAQVQYCLQLIENVTVAGAAGAGDGIVHGDAHANGAAAGGGVENTGIAGTEGFALLPDTGGAPWLALAGGVLLMAGGLLARKVVSR